MSGITWTKFFWSDWQSDPALRLCSYSARGLWMDMLCIAAAHDPIGYVAVSGRALSETDIARMTGGSESEVSSLLGELDRNGVFSRDRHGRIYSRRMISDAKKAAEARKNGKKGGNPTLGKDRGNVEQVNPQDNGGDKPHKPRATSHEREKDKPSLSAAAGAAGGRRSLDEPLPDGFPDAQAIRDAEGWVADAGVALNVAAHAVRFANHARTNDRRARNWPAAWRAWIDIEIEGAPAAAKPRSAAGSPTDWAGPADVLEAVERHRGAAWAVSYLAKCRWDAEARTLTAASVVAMMLRQEAEASLRAINVRIVAEDVGLEPAKPQPVQGVA